MPSPVRPVVPAGSRRAAGAGTGAAALFGEGTESPAPALHGAATGAPGVSSTTLEDLLSASISGVVVGAAPEAPLAAEDPLAAVVRAAAGGGGGRPALAPTPPVALPLVPLQLALPLFVGGGRLVGLRLAKRSISTAAVVEAVHPDGSAAAMGVEPADELVSVDGEAVVEATAEGDLRRHLTSLAAGPDRCVVFVFRRPAVLVPDAGPGGPGRAAAEDVPAKRAPPPAAGGCVVSAAPPSELGGREWGRVVEEVRAAAA